MNEKYIRNRKLLIATGYFNWPEFDSIGDESLVVDPMFNIFENDVLLRETCEAFFPITIDLFTS